MLKKFGSDVITFDGMYGMNYDFQLYTSCFIISNREDEAILSFAFSKVRKKVVTIISKVFMSNMATKFYNAWENIMGSSTYRIYCSWHVLKSWNDNLAKVKNIEKCKEVSHSIQTVQQELDPTRFEILLDAPMEKLKTDGDTLDFATCFISNYATEDKVKR